MPEEEQMLLGLPALIHLHLLPKDGLRRRFQKILRCRWEKRRRSLQGWLRELPSAFWVEAEDRRRRGSYYCARERFYWPALREEVFKLVEWCPACSEFASPRKPEREEVEKPPKGPMESVSCDIFHFARKEVLLTVDNFSSFVWLSFWEDTLGCQDCWIVNSNFLDIPLTYKPVLFLWLYLKQT